jgi:hypothetical integral membrane protein (TIGR02206 family)
MGWFLDPNYAGGDFVLFDWKHLTFLAAIVLFNLSFLWVRTKPESFRYKFRIIYASVSILIELTWHAWKLSIGQWTVQEMLPLHMCSIFVILNAIMMVRKNYSIYEFSYFCSIGGAMQPLLTPDAGQYGLPHYRAWQTLIAHALILSAPIYMTVVEGFRPSWNSLKKVVIGVNIYMLIITPFNFLIGSNYMFTAHKLTTASLLDVLPDWPWYIPFLELIGFAVFSILYMPFQVKDWLSPRPRVAVQ